MAEQQDVYPKFTTKVTHLGKIFKNLIQEIKPMTQKPLNEKATTAK